MAAAGMGRKARTAKTAKNSGKGREASSSGIGLAPGVLAEKPWKARAKKLLP
jgi:hypothetical protein